MDSNRPNHPQHLTAGQFLLRPFLESDAPSFTDAVLESQATVGKWMSWAHSDYSEAEALSWFALCDQGRANKTSYEFGIFDLESEVFVGGGALNQFNFVNGFCNLGYWVRESWQGRGAASAAVQALVRFAFEELKLGRVEIVVATENAPSIAVATKAGAQREGLARNRLNLHGKFTDAYVFSIIPEETRDDHDT